MYRHIKKLMYAVNVGSPDARFGNMLLEHSAVLTASLRLRSRRGPWNTGGKWTIVESPELEQGVE